MASHEHMAALMNGGSSTSTSSSSSENEESPDEQQSFPQQDRTNSVPAKMRLKLHLRLPKPNATSTHDEIMNNPKPNLNGGTPHESPSNETTEEQVQSNDEDEEDETKEDQESTPTNQQDKSTDEDEEDDEVVQATVVNSSDEGGDGTDVVAIAHVEAELVDVPIRSTAPVPPSSTATAALASATRKPRPVLPMTRSVRLPPLSSPGMLIPPTAGVYRGITDGNGFTTPASVFDYCMTFAGYTAEARTERPHRGSSVRRGVGDMFDSDVSLTLNFPSLVPNDWMRPAKENPESSEGADAIKTDGEARDNAHDATQVLLQALAPPADMFSPTNRTSRKRGRPWKFSEMAPLSLTVPYPESYVEKRLRYVEKVDERERAIVASQEAQEKFEDAKERYELRLSSSRRGGNPPSPPLVPEQNTVPPIPEPPSPPRLSELKVAQFEALDDSRHPIYLPKAHEQFTSHLDSSCFHIVDGRYFGLITNGIADPHFVGPNAPGVLGLSLSGGTGLATAYASSMSSGQSASALSHAVYGSVGGGSSGAGGSKATSNKTPAKKITPPSGPKTIEPKIENAAAIVENSAKGGGPPPTSNSTELKKLMDEGGESAAKVRHAIVRAAVYAARVGRHGQSFVAPNGEVYPDVSKAFVAHAGLRPCSRCKNNKQGAYHCRLRRKHKDLDYDGVGNSPAILAPLFNEPLDSLILK